MDAHVTFDRAHASPPSVVTTISGGVGLVDRATNIASQTYAVTETGFTLRVYNANDTALTTLAVQWVAVG